MQFGISALSGDIPGIPDTVARRKQGDLRPNRTNYTDGIPTENAPMPRGWRISHANLGIHRINRNRPDLNQQVAAGGEGIIDFDILQGIGVFNREGYLIGNGFHGGPPLAGDKNKYPLVTRVAQRALHGLRQPLFNKTNKPQ
jgi:hypothetical protein